MTIQCPICGSHVSGDHMTYFHRELKRRAMRNSIDLRGSRRLSIVCDFITRGLQVYSRQKNVTHAHSTIFHKTPGNNIQRGLLEQSEKVSGLLKDCEAYKRSRETDESAHCAESYLRAFGYCCSRSCNRHRLAH